MHSSTRLFLSISALASCLKLLLIPAYRSTDFEVHRNWLAITHSLPLTRWYIDETSSWTLDYPPLFAWMERLLASAAQFIDPQMLVVENLNYASEKTILFQRLSVIVTDLVLTYAVWCWVCYCTVEAKQSEVGASCGNPQIVVTVLSLANVGLVMVDSVHFQYNGVLFGILLISMLRVVEGRYVEGAVWFATLLNLKHIFLYVAPAYGVYMLRVACFSSGPRDMRFTFFRFGMFFTLATAVGAVCVVSLGPFVLAGQIREVLARLFPFKRGLCHAYWAPNFWALYNVADKVVAFLASHAGLMNPVGAKASMTGGLVQEFEHAVLPTVTPLAATVLTIVSILPALFRVWTRPQGSFMRAVIVCAFGSFMFGWHVHEKAILLVIVPLVCLAAADRRDARLFVLLSATGYYSLTPLIFTTAETVAKYALLALHLIFSFHTLGLLHGSESVVSGEKDEEEQTAVAASGKKKKSPAQKNKTIAANKDLNGSISNNASDKNWCLPLLNLQETVYVLGLFTIEVYCKAVHPLLGLSNSLPFLPLMLTSVYSAIGVSYCWAWVYYYFLTS